jgi:hypothetical protein
MANAQLENPVFTDASAPNGSVKVFDAGTSNPSALFSDSGGTPLTNPVSLNARGQAVIFADNAIEYDVIVSDAGGATLSFASGILLPAGSSGATSNNNKFKVSATDSTEDYGNSKIIGSGNTTVTKSGADGAYQTLLITSLNDKVKVVAGGTEGYLDDIIEVVAGELTKTVNGNTLLLGLDADIQTYFKNGSSGYVTPLDDKSIELTSDVDMVSTAGAQFGRSVSFSDPNSSNDGVTLGYLDFNFYDKTESNNRFAKTADLLNYYTKTESDNKFLNTDNATAQSIISDLEIVSKDLLLTNSIETDVTLKSLYLGDNITYAAEGGVDPSENYIIGRNIDVTGKTHWMIGANQSADENCIDLFSFGNSSSATDSPQCHIIASSSSVFNSNLVTQHGYALNANNVSSMDMFGRNMTLNSGELYTVHLGSDAVGESTKIHGDSVNIKDVIDVDDTLVDIVVDVDIGGDLGVTGSITVEQQLTTDRVRVVPQFSTPSGSNGLIFYDANTNTFKGYINGAWKTFTLT